MLLFDLETRSDVDLKKYGAYRYAASPRFEILMASYAVDGGPVHDVEGQDNVLDIPGLFDPKVRKVAHNANFERVCVSAALGLPPGSYLPPEEYDCTAVLAREHGLPHHLAGLGRAVGGEQKSEAGTALIRFFCVPRKDGEFNQPADFPEKWAEFAAYCNQDVATLQSVHDYLQKLGGWPTRAERDAWLADQRINDRGIRIDIELAKHAKHAAELNAFDQKARIRELTGVDNPGSVPQMKAWALDEVIDIPNFQAATIEGLLEGDTLEPHQREVLELRTELAMASSKKYGAALESVLPDDRLRGTLFFYGAHTARWAGRGTQVQNLPSVSFEDTVDAEMTILDLLAGDRISPVDLKRLVRPMFHVDGCSVDYSAIEARVIAWLAGETWALDAFRKGRDIYQETAQRMSTPTRPLKRKHGKVAVLALGFAGGINSLRAMGAEGDDLELRVLVTQWRRANPRIVRLWDDMAEAFSEGGRVGEFIRVTHSFDKMGRTAHVHLPSGRALNYHGIKWERYVIKDPKTGKRIAKTGWRFWDPKFPFNRNARIGTYGGRLTENIVQAVARDILADALVRLEARGYRVVAHVHDEILVEGTTDVDEIAKVMCDLPAWAKGLPMAAEGEIMTRYRKG